MNLVDAILRGRVRRLFPAFALALLATACTPPVLTSEHVDIPTEDRAIVPEFEGRMWQISGGGDEAVEPDFIEVSRDADRTYHFVGRDADGTTDEDDPGTILLRTAHPGVILSVTPQEEDDGAMIYSLFVRSRAGSWVGFPVLGDFTAFAPGTRAEFLNRVARRHKLAIGEEDAPQITGALDSRHLVALFSDPAFLGGLNYRSDLMFRVLPKSAMTEELTDADWWEEVCESLMFVDGLTVTPGSLAQPSGFARRYRNEAGTVEIVEGDPGTYHVIDYPDGGVGGAYRLHLVAMDGIPGHYLGLHERAPNQSGAMEEQQQRYSLSLRRIDDDGTIHTLNLHIVRHDFSQLIDGFVIANRQEAARRHGADMDMERLFDVRDVAALKAILADPQFQSGLVASGWAAEWAVLTPDP